MHCRKIFAIIGALCLFFIAASVQAAEIKVEGNEKQLSVPIKEVNGRSYIATVDFVKIHNIEYFVDVKTKIVTFHYNNEVYKFYVDEKKIETRKGVVSIDNIINEEGYFMLPLREIHSIFGLYTAYDFNKKTYLVSKNKIEDIPLMTQWEIPSMTLNPTSKIHVPILCYHVVSEGRADTLYTPYWKLEDHLKTLKEHGYTAITPKQLYEAYYMNKPLPNKPVLITFDDGYYDNYSLGYPLLKKYDMQATIFIVGNVLRDTQNISINGGLPRLSWANVEEMKSHVTVQNHTYASHYKEVSPSGKEIGVIATPIKVNGKWESNADYWIRIGNDFTKTEQLMKEKVGYGSYIFSYPYGEFSSTTKAVLKQLQIPLAVTVKKGVATKHSNVYELPRLPVDGKWSGEQLIKEINKLK